MYIRNVAIFVLYNKTKKILLQHRADSARRLPGYWAFFGGKIEKNETPLKAVKREAKEKLHYNLKRPKLIMIQKYKRPRYFGLKYIFIEKHNPLKKLIQKEGKSMNWYTISETKRLKMISHDRKTLEYIKNKI